jgi:hypothetical protein
MGSKTREGIEGPMRSGTTTDREMGFEFQKRGLNCR